MKFFHYLSYQLRWFILRKRWLLPLPLVGFIAYRSAHAVATLSQGAFGPARPNAWDLLFVALGNYQNVYLAIGLLYLYLVCDLLPEPSVGQMMLFRLGSRRQWWFGKLVTLFIATLVYILGLTGLLAGAAGLALPWEGEYSSAAQHMPEMVNLPMDFFRKVQPGPPWVHLMEEVLLIILGLFFIGLVMTLVTQLTRRYFIGLATGCLLLASSFITLFFSGRPGWWGLLPGANLTYIGLYPIRTFSVVYSIGYWVAGIGLAGLAGFALSRRQDHLAMREQEDG
jgi:hypothetical protein